MVQVLLLLGRTPLLNFHSTMSHELIHEVLVLHLPPFVLRVAALGQLAAADSDQPGLYLKFTYFVITFGGRIGCFHKLRLRAPCPTCLWSGG
jgi:hypothetical protein